MFDRFRIKEAPGAFTRKLRGAEDICHFRSDIWIEVRDKHGNLKSRCFQNNLRTNVGADFWDSQLFRISGTLTGTNTITSVAAASGTAGPGGSATSVYTGTFTNGGNNAYAGLIFILTGGTTAANNGVFLCIASSTTTITLVNIAGAAQSTGTLPTVSTTVYPSTFVNANWIALTTDATAAAAGDTTLASEETTNGLARAQATDTHTGGASSSLLSKTFTYTGAVTKTIAKVGLFDQSSNGRLILETVLSSTATVNANGDTLTINWTINY
jgi:hypothetical protein